MACYAPCPGGHGGGGIGSDVNVTQLSKPVEPVVRAEAHGRPLVVAAAPLTALLLGLVVALSGARGSDWPAHMFRIELFRDVGLTLWNGQWYGGHYTLGYSVVYPPLASWFGPLAVGIASSVVASAALASMLHRYFGTAGAVAACWFAVGTAVNLAVGRLPFALGLAFGLVALLAYERGWRGLGIIAAPLTSLASPVAGVFLAIALGGIVADLWLRRRAGERVSIAAAAAMSVLTVTPVIATSLLFPDPGVFPFRGAAFAGVVASCVGLVLVLPPTARVLRLSAAIAAIASVPLFLFANPLGGNMTRLVSFFVLPVLGAALWNRRRDLVVAAGIPLALWLVLPGVASAEHIGDPAAEASYHDPVIELVTNAGGQPGRVEVPFTADHWEVAFIAVGGSDRTWMGTPGRHGPQCGPLRRGHDRRRVPALDRRQRGALDRAARCRTRQGRRSGGGAARTRRRLVAARADDRPLADLGSGRRRADRRSAGTPRQGISRRDRHLRRPAGDGPASAPGTCRTGPPRGTVRASRPPTTVCSRWSSAGPGWCTCDRSSPSTRC